MEIYKLCVIFTFQLDLSVFKLCSGLVRFNPLVRVRKWSCFRVKIPGVIDANTAGKCAHVLLKTSAFVAQRPLQNVPMVARITPSCWLKRKVSGGLAWRLNSRLAWLNNRFVNVKSWERSQEFMSLLPLSNGPWSPLVSVFLKRQKTYCKNTECIIYISLQCDVTLIIELTCCVLERCRVSPRNPLPSRLFTAYWLKLYITGGGLSGTSATVPTHRLLL